MNSYQPIPFHILSSAVMLAQKSDVIVEEEKVFERNDRFSQKTSVIIDN